MNLLVVVWIECKLYVTFTDNTKVIGNPHSSLSQHEIPLYVVREGTERGEQRGRGDRRERREEMPVSRQNKGILISSLITFKTPFTPFTLILILPSSYSLLPNIIT